MRDWASDTLDEGGTGGTRLVLDGRLIIACVGPLDSELRKLMAPIGNSSLPVGRSDALVTTDRAMADKLGIQYVC